MNWIVFVYLCFHAILFRKHESGFRQKHAFTLFSSDIVRWHFWIRRHTRLCVRTHILQSDRLTSCPWAFWLLKRDKELFCFHCDSVITQRLTQWNSAATPKGFGPGRASTDSFILSLPLPQSAYLPLFYCLSDRHTHTWYYRLIQALPNKQKNKQTNTYTHSSYICLEECVQRLIRRRMGRRHSNGNASAAANAHTFRSSSSHAYTRTHVKYLERCHFIAKRWPKATTTKKQNFDSMLIYIAINSKRQSNTACAAEPLSTQEIIVPREGAWKKWRKRQKVVRNGREWEGARGWRHAGRTAARSQWDLPSSDRCIASRWDETLSAGRVSALSSWWSMKITSKPFRVCFLQTGVDCSHAGVKHQMLSVGLVYFQLLSSQD